MLLEFLAIFALLLVLIYRWSTATFNFFEERGIDYVKPYPFVGSMWELIIHRKSLFDVTIEMYNNSNRK